ncbi:MAG TPA: hypothetical protein V6D48_19505 [Oculatellaceae cyanobacterium]
MRTYLGKLIAFLTGTVALLVFLYIGLYADTTIAQTSFISNLPAGYQTYPGRFIMGKSCSCSSVGISGAPPGPPPCETSFCFGSSYTRYGWITTNTEGIRATYCDQARQEGRPIPPCFLLDGDDAVVISGSMSPIQDLTYYSFTLYQGFTYDPNYRSNYAAIQASVNLPLNQINLKKGNNGKYALIITANTRTLSIVKRALRISGVPDAIINTYLVPASITTASTLDYPDPLAFSLRLTSQSETEKQNLNTFVQQTIPDTTVIFIKGPGIGGNVTFDDLPKWEETLKANYVEYTTGLDQNLKSLETAVTRNYIQKGYTLKARIPEKLLHVDADACRINHSGCVFDSPDAIYSSFPCDFAPTKRNNNCGIDLQENNKDVLMLLGIDHTLVGNKTLAAYFSGESQKTPGTQDGMFSYIGLYTQGSANQYLPRRKASNLYALKITRDCGSELYCAAIPYLGDTRNKTGFYIVGRNYLDKATGSGPNPANLVPSVLLWFTKS